MQKWMLVALIACLITVPLGSASTPKQKRSSQEIICLVFRSYCYEALSVSWCESKFNIWAGYHKHQYWGLFQMGSWERSKYGHGWNAWAQSRAALKYFNDSGRDWSPWSCRWATR